MSIESVERLIVGEAIPPENVRQARQDLKSLLMGELASSQEDATLAQVIANLAEDKIPHPVAAAYLVRFLAVSNLIPESNSANQIQRNVVAICEKYLPNLCSYVRINEKQQTFDKFNLLRSTHHRICEMLSTLSMAPADLESLVGAKQSFLQVLNHTIVNSYCSPFGISRIRFGVEAMLVKLAKLNTSTVNFAVDLRDCEASLTAQIAFCSENSNFLTNGHFRPFLSATRSALDKFTEGARGRFIATLLHRLPPNNTLQKRHPLQEGREIAVTVPVRNNGPGLALAVKASIETNETDSDDVAFSGSELLLGNIPLGDFSVNFDALMLATCSGFGGLVTLSWEEMGNPERRYLIFECQIAAQKDDTDWVGLENQGPYSTDVAKGAAFVGRSEKVLTLANKMLRKPMESFYVTGQKRVGKTSLAFAAAEFAKAHKQGVALDFCYILWGEVAYGDARAALKEIGRRIVEFIQDTFPKGTRVPELDFESSLGPVTRLVDIAQKVCPDRCYVLIFDEFDEMYPELYMYGDLAETFFSNIRAITTRENICIILVGGENMPFVMDRQGQKLNKFARIGLDYYSRRENEFDDFKMLVRNPTEGAITWHEEAISEIFNVTNGNPYFAKIVCASVFDNAVRKRDSDITADEVRRAVAAEVPNFDPNSFAHLWQDGIYKAEADRAPDILRRRRVLVAIAESIRRGQPVNLKNIIDNKHLAVLPNSEVLPTLNDFRSREVLRVQGEVYEFVLPIFRLWLEDVGMDRLAGDTLAEELAHGAQAADEAAYVHPHEVVALAERWPMYRGRAIGTDNIKAWYEQVDGNQQQRLLFKLLENLKIFSDIQIREKLKTVHESFVQPGLPDFIIKRRSDRRRDVAVTYVDGEAKSGQFYASRYVIQNKIDPRSVISPVEFSKSLEAHILRDGTVRKIVIVDDIIATGRSLAGNVSAFLNRNTDVLQKLNVPIILVVLAATADGEAYVRTEVSKIDWVDFDLGICDLLSDRDFAFSRNGIWEDADESARAKALCTDIGSWIYRDNPLGYGDQGLLVVFPDTCPNNSLPILHSDAHSASKKKWRPLFPRLVN